MLLLHRIYITVQCIYCMFVLISLFGLSNPIEGVILYILPLEGTVYPPLLWHQKAYGNTHIHFICSFSTYHGIILELFVISSASTFAQIVCHNACVLKRLHDQACRFSCDTHC